MLSYNSWEIRAIIKAVAQEDPQLGVTTGSKSSLSNPTKLFAHLAQPTYD